MRKFFLMTILAFLLAVSVASASLSDGLVAYWRFDGGTGTTLRNWVTDTTGGYQNTTGGAVFSYVNGIFGEGINRWNGSSADDDRWVTDYNNTVTGNQLTLSTWFNLESVPDLLTVNYLIRSTETYQLGINNDGKLYFMIWDYVTEGWCSPTLFTSTTTIDTDKWYNIVGTYNGTDRCIYINGTLDSCDDCSDPIGNTSIVELLDGNTPSFNGTLDDTRIYDRALNESEITQLLSRPPNTITDDGTYLKIVTGGAEFTFHKDSGNSYYQKFSLNISEEWSLYNLGAGDFSLPIIYSGGARIGSDASGVTTACVQGCDNSSDMTVIKLSNSGAEEYFTFYSGKDYVNYNATYSGGVWGLAGYINAQGTNGMVYSDGNNYSYTPASFGALFSGAIKYPYYIYQPENRDYAFLWTFFNTAGLNGRVAGYAGYPNANEGEIGLFGCYEGANQYCPSGAVVEGTIGLFDMNFVNSCQAFTTAGEYLVTQNITADIDNCFDIQTDGVRINLGGYALIGNSSFTGIYANDKNNISISNGFIEGFNRGIDANLHSSEIRNIEFGGQTSKDIQLTGTSSDNLLSNNTFRSNVGVNAGSGNTIEKNNFLTTNGENSFSDAEVKDNYMTGACSFTMTGGKWHDNTFDHTGMDVGGGDYVSVKIIGGEFYNNLFTNLDSAMNNNTIEVFATSQIHHNTLENSVMTNPYNNWITVFMGNFTNVSYNTVKSNMGILTFCNIDYFGEGCYNTTFSHNNFAYSGYSTYLSLLANTYYSDVFENQMGNSPISVDSWQLAPSQHLNSSFNNIHNNIGTGYLTFGQYTYGNTYCNNYQYVNDLGTNLPCVEENVTDWGNMVKLNISNLNADDYFVVDKFMTFINTANITKEVRVARCNMENTSWSNCTYTFLPVQAYNITGNESATLLFLTAVHADSYVEVAILYNNPSATERTYNTDLRWDGSGSPRTFENSKYRMTLDTVSGKIWDYYWKGYSNTTTLCHHDTETDCIDTMWILGDTDGCSGSSFTATQIGEVFVEVNETCTGNNYRTFRMYYDSPYIDFVKNYDQSFPRVGYISSFDYAMNDSEWRAMPSCDTSEAFRDDGSNYFAINSSTLGVGIAYYFNMLDVAPKGFSTSSYSGCLRRELYMENGSDTFFYGTQRMRVQGYSLDLNIPVNGNTTYNNPATITEIPGNVTPSINIVLNFTSINWTSLNTNTIDNPATNDYEIILTTSGGCSGLLSFLPFSPVLTNGIYNIPNSNVKMNYTGTVSNSTLDILDVNKTISLNSGSINPEYYLDIPGNQHYGSYIGNHVIEGSCV
jgi:hypothetical protein